MIVYILAAVPCFIWLYLLLLRGGFWRVSRQLACRPQRRNQACRVVAIIPARNEAAYIGETVRSLLRQDFEGWLHVVVVDDGSEDGTAHMAVQAAASCEALANLTVLRAPALPSDWSGKVWAMSHGVEAAAALAPDFLLFTDADIEHSPDNLVALIATAQAHEYDLTSYMVQLSVVTWAERCLIPAFVFFFLKLYPPAWVRSSGSGVAGAAGGCMLMRPECLSRIGGLAAIRSQIIDDCALARAVKRAGGSVCLELTRTARSNRRYESLGEVGRMISRTAFNQLQHSYLLLALTLVGLFFCYLLPPLLLCSGRVVAMTLSATAWALMSICYAPMVRFYGLSARWSLGLPAAALFYAAATAHSALKYRLGHGGQWKGRAQDRAGAA